MDSNDVLSLSSLLVAWLQRTCDINLCHDRSSMKVIDLKKAKKLLKAQSFQCKPGFVLAKFVYLSLDNVCIFIEWVQLTSYSTAYELNNESCCFYLLSDFLSVVYICLFCS